MLKHVSVYITLITAILYTLGLNYYLGFLGEFGLQESMFPLTLDQTIYSGLVPMILIGIKPILWLLLAIGVVLVFASIVDFSLKWLQKKRAVDTNAPETTTASNDKSRYEIGADRLFIFTIVILLVFGGALFISWASAEAGKAAAQKYDERIKQGDFNSKSIFLKEGEEVLKGYSIMSSSQQYAFMIDGKPTVFNMADIKMIVSNQDKIKSKK